ncbi:hypothetical protein KXD93_21800 [Mucilaginibacter sp. BJC16-A38]|uniref:hypothetical protein n=1 Tax=Mucilaginibacter phenanthrenivorans TaxID=1234842 RepID=UPI002157A96F|nr:hypothetical protein [Mucilaginibacter phenanthrenivorans]MCR8560302.1 hypothetical protein [Mucilaginibacter phenanthrenivorans]
MPKLTSEQRRLASVDLTCTYLDNYYSEWRYTKVLTLQKLINNRYEFYADLAPQVKSDRDETGEATIAQEIQNGLYFDTIAQCIQYIEDLFALIRASRQPEFFIRNIITYKAGEVTNFIKSFKAERKHVAAAFHFPDDLPYDRESDQIKYTEGAERLTGYIAELVQFYKDYDFFYNQYKHGLSVAMRPLGNIFTAEQVAKDKAGEMPPFLAAYDNMNLAAGFKKGTAKTTHGILMLGFTENVMPYISQLGEENNYLRLANPADWPHFHLDILVQKALMTKCCLQLFIFNYAGKIKPGGTTFTFRLPTDYKTKEVTQCSYVSKPEEFKKK